MDRAPGTRASWSGVVPCRSVGPTAPIGRLAPVRAQRQSLAGFVLEPDSIALGISQRVVCRGWISCVNSAERLDRASCAWQRKGRRPIPPVYAWLHNVQNNVQKQKPPGTHSFRGVGNWIG
jgi:hypothetical protein